MPKQLVAREYTLESVQFVLDRHDELVAIKAVSSVNYDDIVKITETLDIPLGNVPNGVDFYTQIKAVLDSTYVS